MKRMVSGMICEIVEQDGKFYAKNPARANWVSSGSHYKEVPADVVNWAEAHITDGTPCPCGRVHLQDESGKIIS